MGAKKCSEPCETYYEPNTSEQTTQTYYSQSSQTSSNLSDENSQTTKVTKPKQKEHVQYFTPLQEISNQNLQTPEKAFSHDNYQIVEEGSSYKNAHPIQKYLTPLQAIQENIFNENAQALEEGFSHENIQTVGKGSFYTNIQPTQKKSFTTLEAIQEDIGNGNFQTLKESSPHKNVQTLEGRSSHRNIQMIQKKKPSTTLQAIQEDISNENLQVLEKGSSQKDVQAVEERFSHKNDQSVQEKFSYEKVKTASEDSSQENDQSKEEGSSQGNVQTMNDGFSCRNNQLAQEEAFHKNNQMTQEESFNRKVQVRDEGFFHGNIQVVKKESSHRNDQLVQEVFPYEKIQRLEESLQENDQDNQEASSQENVQSMDEGSSCRNDQKIQEMQSSPSDDQTAQKKPFHRNDKNVEDGIPYANDQVTEEEGYPENKCCTWLKKISVEPTMWLYMMAFMFTSVVEQAFFVYKACRVDHGYTEEICSNLNVYKDIKTEVQKTVSEFQQWYNFAGHIVPIILAMFFGNWSDRRGRKLPLIIGLTGKLIYSFMIVINSLMKNWNLNMVTYTAVIPMGILGGDVIIFGSCFAYLTDICSLEERTIRITILDVVYLTTMPTGIALGSYVFNAVNSSYAIMFAINSCMLVLAIIYSLMRLKWQSSAQQQSFVGVNFLRDFFDIEHVKETVNMIIKRRPNNGRMCLALVMLSMCLYTFQRDEKPMSFLYTQLVFNWDVTTFSNFRTFQSFFFVAAMLCAMPLMKYLRLKDTIIIIIGAVSHAAGRLVFIMAQTGKVFYGGAVVAALGPVVAPALRSMASKFVLLEERGKVFAILSVFDNAVPLISSVLYSQIYNATISTVPNFIYWLTFITQICVMLLAIIIHFVLWNIGFFTNMLTP